GKDQGRDQSDGPGDSLRPAQRPRQEHLRRSRNSYAGPVRAGVLKKVARASCPCPSSVRWKTRVGCPCYFIIPLVRQVSRSPGTTTAPGAPPRPPCSRPPAAAR